MGCLSTIKFFVVISCVSFCAEHLHAATPANTRTSSKKPVQYIRDIGDFKSDLSLEVSSTPRLITLSDEQVRYRTASYTTNPTVEPLQLTVPSDDDKIMELSKSLATKGQRLSLANYIRKNLDTGEAIPGSNLKLVTVDKKALDLIDRDALEDLFTKTHSELIVSTANLKQSRDKNVLLRQLSYYLTTSQLQKVRTKIERGESLNVDKDLLPSFARKVVRHHTVFKGPNCFHAALSFQSTALPKSSLVNVREEAGYHRDMINYDELWRVVQREFHEVNVSSSNVQYGDMIIFFDTPKTAETSIDFHSLRHAATYLFGGYVFAKGSKSANSPYLIKPLAEEWNTWSKYTDNLGVKVFRRNNKHVKKGALWDPHDWLY